MAKKKRKKRKHRHLQVTQPIPRTLSPIFKNTEDLYSRESLIGNSHVSGIMLVEEVAILEEERIIKSHIAQTLKIDHTSQKITARTLPVDNKVRNFIRENRGTYLCEIARALNLSPSVISRSIARLKSLGFIDCGDPHLLTTGKWCLPLCCITTRSLLGQEERKPRSAIKRRQPATSLECDAPYRPFYDWNGCYQRYLNSEAWQQIRVKVLDRDGYKCVRCGTGNGLHVHHKNYNSVYNERTEDLEVLCSDCHAGEHEKNGRAIPGKIERHNSINNPQQREGA